MAYKSFAVLVLSASAALAPVASAMASPIGNLLHLRPHLAPMDTRVYVSLYNQSLAFRDIKIDGHHYTVRAHEYINIKAPVGTTVYADSPTPMYRRGDVMLVVVPQLNNRHIKLD